MAEMSKTPEEIKKGLACCADRNIVCTGNCAYEDEDYCFPDCMQLMQEDALAYGSLKQMTVK